jgi:hypothetical protein
MHLHPSLSLFFLDKFKEPELAINESEKLWLDVARTISTFQAEASTTNIKGKTDDCMLDDRRPVHVPKHVDVPAPRFMEYARWDLVRFQRRIRERPFDKEGVISEIDENMKLWSEWFKPTAPEIQELMDAFSALLEALSKDPEPFAASILAQRDRARQRADAVKVSHVSVSAACSSLSKFAQSFEEKVNLHEQQLHHHSSRAEELRAQIELLTSQLKEAEACCTQAVCLKEQAIGYMAENRERLAKTASFKLELEASSVPSQSQLQNIDDDIASLTEPDSEGLTRHIRSLLDFFASSKFES